MHRILELERSVKRLQARLGDAIYACPDAVAYLEDGVIVRANPAWAACFGFENPNSISGLPLMHLFAQAEHSRLRDAVQSAIRADSTEPPLTLELKTEAGGESPLTVELSPLPGSEPARLQIAVRGKDAPAESELQIEELEGERNRLAAAIEALDGSEHGPGLRTPSDFAAKAAERLDRPLGGSLRALVAFRPADLSEATRVLGPLGIAGVGGDIAETLAPILVEGDVATRLDDLNVLVLVDRKDEGSVRKWIESALHALGTDIFEAGSRSTHIAFVAGYATADGIRQLEALARQALQAAKGPENTVHHADPETHSEATGTSNASWEVFIPEAFQERRFAIALRPIQDIASGSTLHAASPRLLDRDGREIDAETFYGPASDLGLLTNIERRFLGYAFFAQMQLQQAGKSARMIVPLSADALDDPALPALLRSIGTDPDARRAIESLVVEFEQNDIAGRIRDVERVSHRFGEFGCGLGVRGFVPVRAAERLLDDLNFSTLRLASDVVERLAGDESQRSFLAALAQRCAKAGTMVIAAGVPDTEAMAMFYNLGVGCIEGPVIGPWSLHHFRNGNRSGQGTATNATAAPRVEDRVIERISDL